jgi:tripartite-type tricarboxylate transporter receptor subunit TctC
VIHSTTTAAPPTPDPSPPRRRGHSSSKTGVDALSASRAGGEGNHSAARLRFPSHRTGDARLAVAPDIPSFGELGLPALSLSNWYGLFAPKGTPRDIIGKLHAAAVEALADAAVRSRLVELGFGVFPREQQTPDALAALQKADAGKWWPIIKESGIKAE